MNPDPPETESVIVHIRAPVRLDRYLTRRLSHVSRSRIQRHIEQGDVLVNGRRVRPSQRLLGGETLTMPSLAERRLDVASEEVELRIVHEDAELIVVDKPAGVLVHPVGNEFRRTLLNGLYHHLMAAGESAAGLGLVHRLDRWTSGLIVVAKTDRARRSLAGDVENRRVRRRYLAVVAGTPPTTRGAIDLHIRRDPARPTRMQALDAAQLERAAQTIVPWHVSESGYSDPRRDTRPRHARTRYRVVRRYGGATLVCFELETGRTHQIRVHARAADMPLLGDPLYGPDAIAGRGDGGSPTMQEGGRRLEDISGNFARPALHAARLEFTHPGTGASMRFRAALPEDMRQLLEELARLGSDCS